MQFSRDKIDSVQRQIQILSHIKMIHRRRDSVLHEMRWRRRYSVNIRKKIKLTLLDENEVSFNISKYALIAVLQDAGAGCR